MINDLNVFVTLRVMIDVKFTTAIMMFFNLFYNVKKTYFVIYLIFVIKSFERRIREINDFYAIFDFKIVLDENKCLFKLTSIQRRRCHEITQIIMIS